MKSFFSKKIVVGALVAATVCVSGITGAKAQEFAVQGDIVSSYVWRGMYQGGGTVASNVSIRSSIRAMSSGQRRLASRSCVKDVSVAR